MKLRTWLLLFVIIASTSTMAQKKYQSNFQVVPLGVKGGIDETNLSAYMVAPTNSTDFICLDAGSVTAGIEKSIKNKVFNVSAEEVLKKYIKGFFISHAHLDHVSGLIISSPADSTKTIYAPKKCMDMMKNHYFNDETWANFGDSGLGYLIKRYHFQDLQFGSEVAITNTSMFVTAFPLSHVNPYESAAFLIKNKEAYILYLGDTGADEVEKSDKLEQLWKNIAPLIVAKELKGVFIEVSFSNEQPENSLYGHLTPKLLLKELHELEKITGKGALKDFAIIVTHVKPPLKNIKLIKKQLKESNNLGVKFIFPEQGKRFEL